MEKGDIIIDGGNSEYTDTNVRCTSSEAYYFSNRLSLIIWQSGAVCSLLAVQLALVLVHVRIACCPLLASTSAYGYERVAVETSEEADAAGHRVRGLRRERRRARRAPRPVDDAWRLGQRLASPEAHLPGALPVPRMTTNCSHFH